MIATSPIELWHGRYRLGRVLGEGGMATVHFAVDTRLEVHRAVKILAPAMCRHPSLRARFENEARTMARLRHPNILVVHDVGIEGAVPFMVMDLALGGCLLERLADGALRPGVACDVMAAVLSALHFAHESGVVHRDVKPHNVLLTEDGRPLVSDFGIARSDSLGRLTRTGMAMGTDLYMAPEQRVAAQNAERRADVYSAGVTLYVLVTGREPFEMSTLAFHPELDARHLGDIDAELADVIRTATRFDPGERYPTAHAMREALLAARRAYPPEPDDVLRMDPEHAKEVYRTAHTTPPSTAMPSSSSGARTTTLMPVAPPPRRGSAMLVLLALLLVLVAVTVSGVAAAGLAWSLVRAPMEVPTVPTVPALVPKPVLEEDPPAVDVPTVPPLVPARRRTDQQRPASGVGTLYLNSVPWSTVEVDGLPRGRTGWSGEVSAGTHQVTFTSPDGRTTTRTVEVPAGGTVRTCWDFHQGIPCSR